MTYAYMRFGRVAHVASTPDEPMDGATVIAAPDGQAPQIGDEWDGAGFVAPAAALPPVPDQIPPLQGMLAIDAAGLSAAYEAWANDPARTFAERAFIQRAAVWRRNDPLLVGAATALGLTAEMLDDLFVAAASL